MHDEGLNVDSETVGIQAALHPASEVAAVTGAAHVAGAAQVAGAGAAHVGAGPQVAGAGAGPHQEPASMDPAEPDLDDLATRFFRTPSALTPAIVARRGTAEENRIVVRKLNNGATVVKTSCPVLSLFKYVPLNQLSSL